MEIRIYNDYDFNSRKIRFRELIAVTLEYLSMFPSMIIIFEMFPFLKKIFKSYENLKSICLPFYIRIKISKILPEYDPYLKEWPKSVKEYNILEEKIKNIKMRKIKKLLKRHKYLEAYELWWACRRPATRRRLTLPLYKYFGGDKRPFISTIFVFTWSGFLHAIYYPLFPIYFVLSFYGLAHYLFLLIWYIYIVLGLPIAFNKIIKSLKLTIK